ncbi:MAG: glycosyltransferase family 1 protein [Chitinophagaceae bacterium]|nr:glycosyltransferase family 1 protein [Chitinophagaceae bacterium]
MHFAVISAPVPGHLYPNCMLAKELIRRGHTVTVYNIPDSKFFVEKLGVQYYVIAEKEFPLGFWNVQWKGARTGSNVFRDTRILNIQIDIADIMMRDLPAILKQQAVDVLLVDHLQPQGASIAEHLGLPFITICSILPLHPDPTGMVPPSFAWWIPTGNIFDKCRNKFGHWIVGLFARHYYKTINKWRRQWQLKPEYKLTNSFSSLAQISVMPEMLDFPRPFISPVYYPVGPFVEKRDEQIVFPWDKLNGKPIVYVSLGTIRNHIAKVFFAIVKAFENKPHLQLIISKGAWCGGGINFNGLPESAIIMDYVPQLEVLQKASLCITHAGPGTIFECIHYCVPLVAIPIADDQPAMGARVKYHKLGEVIPWRKISAGKVSKAVDEVLSNPVYKNNCAKMSKVIHLLGGVKEAGDIVEQILGAGNGKK